MLPQSSQHRSGQTSLQPFSLCLGLSLQTHCVCACVCVHVCLNKQYVYLNNKDRQNPRAWELRRSLGTREESGHKARGRHRWYPKSPTTQDVFWLISGFISCPGVTGRWGPPSHVLNAVRWLALRVCACCDCVCIVWVVVCAACYSTTLVVVLEPTLLHCVSPHWLQDQHHPTYPITVTIATAIHLLYSSKVKGHLLPLNPLSRSLLQTATKVYEGRGTRLVSLETRAWMLLSVAKGLVPYFFWWLLIHSYSFVLLLTPDTCQGEREGKRGEGAREGESERGRG